MVVEAEDVDTFGVRAIRVRRLAADVTANVLSQAACPPILAVAMIALAAAASGAPGAWRFASLYILLALVLPLTYLVWLLRRGHVSDLDVQVRAERWRPLLGAVSGMVLSTAVFTLAGAPAEMSAVCAALGLFTFLAFVITLRWKISMHSGAAAAAVTLIWLTGSTAAWPLTLGVPVIAWARVHLHRHTIAQTIAGALLGSFLMALALYLTVLR
jgi:hypothetical protein